jgi:hypothetical protein
LKKKSFRFKVKFWQINKMDNLENMNDTKNNENEYNNSDNLSELIKDIQEQNSNFDKCNNKNKNKKKKKNKKKEIDFAERECLIIVSKTLALFGFISIVIAFLFSAHNVILQEDLKSLKASCLMDSNKQSSINIPNDYSPTIRIGCPADPKNQLFFHFDEINKKFPLFEKIEKEQGAYLYSCDSGLVKLFSKELYISTSEDVLLHIRGETAVCVQKFLNCEVTW